MTEYTKLYLDSEGIERGYYVYLHREKESGRVFYVGMGHGRRAWETSRRNKSWKKVVGGIGTGWVVEIVRSDLSQIEAYELEEQLVEEFGGSAFTGGPLTNHVPGGEAPLAIKLTFSFDDGGFRKEYCKARQFRRFATEQESEMARKLESKMKLLEKRVEPFLSEADVRGDDKLMDECISLEGELLDVRTFSSDLLRKRISWKTFCLALEDANVRINEECTEFCALLSIAQEMAAAVRACFEMVDSGNRDDAVQLAKTRSGIG